MAASSCKVPRGGDSDLRSGLPPLHYCGHTTHQDLVQVRGWVVVVVPTVLLWQPIQLK